MDGRDSAKCQKSKIRDTGNFGKIINEEKDKNLNSGLLPSKRPKKPSSGSDGLQWAGFCDFFLEREHLLSRISANQTVGSRRSKKQSCST